MNSHCNVFLKKTIMWHMIYLIMAANDCLIIGYNWFSCNYMHIPLQVRHLTVPFEENEKKERGLHYRIP